MMTEQEIRQVGDVVRRLGGLRTSSAVLDEFALDALGRNREMRDSCFEAVAQEVEGAIREPERQYREKLDVLRGHVYWLSQHLNRAYESYSEIEKLLRDHD